MGDDLGAAGQAHDLAAPLVYPGPAAGEVAGAGGVAGDLVDHPAARALDPPVDAADDRHALDGAVQGGQLVPNPGEEAAH